MSKRTSERLLALFTNARKETIDRYKAGATRRTIARELFELSLTDHQLSNLTISNTLRALIPEEEADKIAKQHQRTSGITYIKKSFGYDVWTRDETERLRQLCSDTKLRWQDGAHYGEPNYIEISKIIAEEFGKTRSRQAVAYKGRRILRGH